MSTIGKDLIFIIAFICALFYFDAQNEEMIEAYYGDPTKCKVWPNDNRDYYLLRECD